MALPISSETRLHLEDLEPHVIEALARVDQLGELHFSEVVPKLHAVRRLLDALISQDPDDVPRQIVDQVAATANQFRNLVQQIRGFNVMEGNPSERRLQLIHGVESERSSAMQALLPFVRGHEVDLSSTRTETHAALAEARKLLDEARAAAAVTTASQSTAEDIVASLRQLSGQGASAALSSHYATAAKSHRTTAGAWLRAAIAFSIGTAAVALGLFATLDVDLKAPDSGTQWAELVRNLVIRLFFLGLMSFAIGFAVRSYRSNKHLEIVNDQKRSALDTFTLFVQAAGTDDERGMITAELVRVVFNIGDTGYIVGGEDRPPVDSGAVLSLLMKRGT